MANLLELEARMIARDIALAFTLDFFLFNGAGETYLAALKEADAGIKRELGG